MASIKSAAMPDDFQEAMLCLIVAMYVCVYFTMYCSI